MGKSLRINLQKRQAALTSSKIQAQRFCNDVIDDIQGAGLGGSE